MTDARYPERWLNDRRLLHLSDRAHRTFVTLLTWSVSNRTDGHFVVKDVAFIPHANVDDIPELTAAELVVIYKGGWLITDYDATQTTAAQLNGLEAGRIAEREKKARQRACKAGNHSLCRPDTCSAVSVPGDVLGDTKDRPGQDRPGQAPRTSTPNDDGEPTEWWKKGA